MFLWNFEKLAVGHLASTTYGEIDQNKRNEIKYDEIDKNNLPTHDSEQIQLIIKFFTTSETVI